MLPVTREKKTPEADPDASDTGDDSMDVDIDELKDIIGEEEEEVDDDDDEEYYISDPDEIIPVEENEDNGSDVQLSDDDDDTDNYIFDFEDDEEMMNDEFEFRNILKELNNMKVRRRKGGYKAVRRRGEKVSPEVRALLSMANEAFVRGDFQVALESYLEVVKIDPKNFAAYKTIGEIYKSQGKLTKCCNFWILAAHLRQWDSDFWTTVGDLSYELGHTRQAMYCYSRAVKSGKKTNLQAIFKRGILFRETGQYIKAADSFMKLFKLDPTNENILKELIVVYVNQNRIGEAIDTYYRIWDDNVNFRKAHATNPNLTLNTVTFGWSELNILTELRAKQTAWIQGINLIKNISRWIQGRESQTWWTDSVDDSEFDERRFENPKYRALSADEQRLNHDLPIDIRVQLGLFRLNSGSHSEALRSFEFLLNSDTDDNADLFYEVGKALEDKMMYTEALKFFSSLSHVDDYNNSELIFSISKCLLNAHHYVQAKEAYEACLAFEPDNVDVLTNLVEIGSALGDQDYVDDIVEKIYDLKEQYEMEEEEGGDAAERSKEGEMVDDESNLALIENTPKDSKKHRLAKLTDQEWYLKDQQLTNFISENFQRAERLLPGLKKGDKFSSDTWMETVTNLIEIFVPARGFFYGEKCEPLKKMLVENRTSEPSLNRRLARITRVREQNDLDKRTYGKLLENTGSFRGKTFEEWFEILMEYALNLAKLGDKNCFLVLQACEGAICFNNDNFDKLLILVGISLSAQFDNSEKLSHYTRTCLLQHQFSSLAVRLFILIHQGPNELTEENHSSQQKFFLRQIKAFDSVRLSSKIPGQASIYISDIDTSHEHPLLNYVYSGLLLSSKSYISQLAYLHKLVDDGWKNDPMLYFCLGIGHIHRAMNRLANNRNFEILQGIAYLMQYIEMKLKDKRCTEFDIQETDYNLGRAFHMLGLVSLATDQYKKVLDRKIGFLEAEASYNMYLIQNIYGTGQEVELMTV